MFTDFLLKLAFYMQPKETEFPLSIKNVFCLFKAQHIFALVFFGCWSYILGQTFMIALHCSTTESSSAEKLH